MFKTKNEFNRSKNILVVEDDPDVRELIALVLSEEFDSISQASSGNAAWDMVKSKKFDMVVCDMRMPDGSGEELLANIKNSNDKDLPIVFVTGFSDFSEASLLDAGAKAVILKPFDTRQLIQVVKMYLRS